MTVLWERGFEKALAHSHLPRQLVFKAAAELESRRWDEGKFKHYRRRGHHSVAVYAEIQHLFLKYVAASL